MATVSELFGTSNQTITITLASLANQTNIYTGRQSTDIANTGGTPALDALVMLKVATAGSGVSATGTVLVYAYGSVDGGTTYSDGIAGTDGAWTGTNPPNVRLIGILNTVAVSTTYYGGPFSVAAAFGGTLPQYWGIAVVNNSGAALAASGNAAYYQLVNQTVA